MCVKMQLIQLQAGYENAQVLGEKDGSQFEEESSEADDEQTGIKGEDEADETDGKSEIEFGNNSPGADKLESIIEEKENVEEVAPTPKKASQRLLSIFEGKEVVDDVPDKNVNSREGFEGGDLKKREMREKDVTDREKLEELVSLRETTLAKAVLFITRQLSIKEQIYFHNLRNIHFCGCQA